MKLKLIVTEENEWGLFDIDNNVTVDSGLKPYDIAWSVIEDDYWIHKIDSIDLHHILKILAHQVVGDYE